MTEPSLESIARAQDRTLLIVEQLSEKMHSRIEQTDAWRARIDLIIMGDGNGRPGHHVKIDRMERTIRAQMWFIRALTGGIIALLLKTISELF